MALSNPCKEILKSVAESLGPGPPDNPEAAKEVEALLEKYDKRYEQEARAVTKRSGLNMTLPKEVVGGEAVTVFGHVPGIKPGAKFRDRGQLYVVGVHATLMKGIHAPAAKHPDYPRGAYSVLMSGGYVDDEDMGESFWYTGEGGIDAATKRQVKDQSMERGSNAALRNNCDSRTPVRVVRGYVTEPGSSGWAQGSEGVATGGGAAGGAGGIAGVAGARGGDGAGGGKKKGFVYEGLYVVLQYKQEPSKDGPLVCKFLLHGVLGHSTVNTRVEFGIFGGVPTGSRLHARRLAGPGPSGGARSGAVQLAKRARVERDRKALEAARKVMLAQIRGRYPASVLLSDDISGGQEPVPIPLVNEVNDETLPPGFKYIRSYEWAKGVHKLVLPVLHFLDEEMAEFTRAPENGTCGLAFNRMIAARDRAQGQRLPPEYEPHLEEQYNAAGCLLITDPCGLHECGDKCSSAKCRLNKQLTNGVALPLEVFMTEAKGWGVRCREPILAGAFVCAYVGQLLTDHMAEVRKGRDHYLFDLDFFTHIYTEMAEKGLDAVQQDIPRHKIPPVLSVAMVKELQAKAAAKARQLAAATAEEEEKTAAAGGPSSSNGGGRVDGVLTPAEVRAEARGLLDSCRAVAAAAQAAGWTGGSGGERGRGDVAPSPFSCRGGGGAATGPLSSQPNGTAAAANGAAAAAAATPLPQRRESDDGVTSPSPLVAAAATAVVACEAANPNPGAFYLTQIFSRDPAEDAAGAAAAPTDAEEEEYAPILVLDARSSGNVGRFLNHSCDGNLTIQAVFAGPYRNTFLYHVGLYAARDIPAMTELTYNYGYSEAGRGAVRQYGMECHCGAPGCVGQLM